jgi:hypothetical protein
MNFLCEVLIARPKSKARCDGHFAALSLLLTIASRNTGSTDGSRLSAILITPLCQPERLARLVVVDSLCR